MRRGVARGIASAAVLFAFACATAFGATFELEPKTSTDPPNGFIRDDTTNGPVDWTSLFDVPTSELDNDFTNDSDSAQPTPKTTNMPAGVFRAGFFRDFLINSTTDTTTFATGSKDIHNPSGGGTVSGSWQCKKANNISDKGDVLNAYAAIYQHTNGDIMLAFGAERATGDGTSKVGFWFLQDKTIDCEQTGGGTETFTGNHVDGDLLVVINFSQGGNNPTAVIYQWTGDGTTGHLNTDPLDVIVGSECTIGTDLDCATTNQTQTILHTGGGIPWLTQVKQSGNSFGHNLGPLLFFEGQVNLTDHDLQRCFTRYMANTRQSDSTSSTMFDFVIGDFDVCGFTASKSCTSASVTSGTDVNYNFNVNVVNAGIAPLEHVTVTENVNGCSVTSSNDETIAAGGNKDFTVECTDVGLGFINQATVNAKDEDGNALASVTVEADVDDYDGEGQACFLNTTSDIDMANECDNVVLKNQNGLLGFEATIKMLVKAPSSANSEALNDVKINVYDKDCTSEIGECAIIETIDVASQLKNGDADVEKTHTYDVAPGDNASESLCTNEALFQRRVIAYGTGAISGGTYYSQLNSSTPVTEEAITCRPCVNCDEDEEPPAE